MQSLTWNTPNHERADTYTKLTLIFAIGTGNIVRPLSLAVCRGLICGVASRIMVNKYVHKPQ